MKITKSFPLFSKIRDFDPDPDKIRDPGIPFPGLIPGYPDPGPGADKAYSSVNVWESFLKRENF